MSRRTRLQQPVPIRGVKLTTAEYMVKLRREVKRRLIADGLISDPSKQPPKYEWHWKLGERGGIVVANNGGEARGLIKKELGLKQRLPNHIQIVRVIPNADQRKRLESCQIGSVQG